MNLEGYKQLAAQSNNCIAWLRVLREGESSQDDETAFHELYGGERFESFDDHPRKHFALPGGSNTSAAGAYQITETTWNDFTSHFGSMPFTPENQGACALWLTDRAGALNDVIAGRLHEAIARCTGVWTSLAIPKRQQEARSIFAAYGGTLESAPVQPQETQAQEQVTVTPAAPAKDKSMPIFAAFLPAILQALPQLISVFGSPNDSEVAKRNQAAGVVVADTLVKATQAVNLQDAVEKIQNDPDALDAAHKAVNDLLPQLVEAGGGGIDGARKAAMAPDQLPFWRQGAFYITVLLILMPFLLLVDVFFVHPDNYDGNLRTQIVTAVLLVIGMVGAYWLGSSAGSQKKDSILGAK